MSDICSESFYYVTDNGSVKIRPEFLKLSEVKAISKMEDADKVFLFINLYINKGFYSTYTDKRRIDVIKNEAKLPFDWKVTKEVQTVINKFEDAQTALTDASINELKAVIKDSIAMLAKSREKIGIRIDALDSLDFAVINDTLTEVNIADIITKTQADFKFVIDISKTLVTLTATINDLEKKVKGTEKKEKPVDPLMQKFDN